MSVQVIIFILKMSVPLDEFDGFEGFVHVSDGEVEAEVQHGVSSGFLAALQPDEISEGSSHHHLRCGGHLGGRRDHLTLFSALTQLRKHRGTFHEIHKVSKTQITYLLN